MKKLTKMLAAAGLTATLLLSMTGLSGCGRTFWRLITGKPLVITLEEKCVTTEDGFTYYLDDERGLCIIKLPEKEKVIIPEYIDGHQVKQFGYEEPPITIGAGSTEYWVTSSYIKELTIENYIYFGYIKDFTALEKVVFINYLDNIGWDTSDAKLKRARVFNTLNRVFKMPVEVELRKGDRAVDLSAYSLITIDIPEYVTVIEKGVFDGIEGVTFKTPYESKPDGWEEGWNGNCKVEWGVELPDWKDVIREKIYE